jgi:hypothetical protein
VNTPIIEFNSFIQALSDSDWPKIGEHKNTTTITTTTTTNNNNNNNNKNKIIIIYCLNYLPTAKTCNMHTQENGMQSIKHYNNKTRKKKLHKLNTLRKEK